MTAAITAVMTAAITASAITTSITAAAIITTVVIITTIIATWEGEVDARARRYGQARDIDVKPERRRDGYTADH
jgi:hypothetical protein